RGRRRCGDRHGGRAGGGPDGRRRSDHQPRRVTRAARGRIRLWPRDGIDRGSRARGGTRARREPRRLQASDHRRRAAPPHRASFGRPRCRTIWRPLGGRARESRCTRGCRERGAGSVWRARPHPPSHSREGVARSAWAGEARRITLLAPVALAGARYPPSFLVWASFTNELSITLVTSRPLTAAFVFASSSRL